MNDDYCPICDHDHCICASINSEECDDCDQDPAECFNSRVDIFNLLFENLTMTNSRNDKELLIDEFERTYPELKEDLTYILETLDGQHPIGWTFQPALNCGGGDFADISSMIMYLEGRKKYPGLSLLAQTEAERTIGTYGAFIEQIVNRTLRLGIGKSLLRKTDRTPMLAKKYEPSMIFKQNIFVTEKLDGNRCIAQHDGEKWVYTSRNGKPMNVAFDMTGLNQDFIYDGEVMSGAQTELSIRRTEALLAGKVIPIVTTEGAQKLFSETSGLINQRRIRGEKSLVYNIFDIIEDLMPYYARRNLLDRFTPTGNDVRIIPSLYKGNDIQIIDKLLDDVCAMGGEGIMLNKEARAYEHKRSDALLKYKKVQYMDMRVIGITEGRGKYEGLVGALVCEIVTDDGKYISCEVGTGLSDEQRESWAEAPMLILGKIVEVGYHELSQSVNQRGTKFYSVRFPRLVRVREDKDDTSIY